MNQVTLINPFKVPPFQEESFLDFWGSVAAYMRLQPGFLSTRLHKAAWEEAHFRFINVAIWESEEHFQAAIDKAEFKELTAPYRDVFPHYPSLYEVVRT